MRMIFGKLVRDKIPDIMKIDGCTNIGIKRLDDVDYRKALALKLEEESAEISIELRNNNREKIIEELADVEEVIAAIKVCVEIKDSEIAQMRDKKNQQKGSFLERLWLVYADI